MTKSLQGTEASTVELPTKKLAIVVKSLDPQRGGHEYYINRLIRGLLERGYHIWCFAESFGERAIKHPHLKEVKITPFKLAAPLRMLWFNYRSQTLVKNHPFEFDFVFTTGSVTFGDIYRAGGGVHATYVDNCVSPIARYSPKHLTAKYLQKKLFQRNTPQLLITNSVMVKNDIQERYRVPEERIRVIRNGIDVDRFNPKNARKNRNQIRGDYGYDDQDFVCLFTTGGGGRKGLAELLLAFSGIQNDTIRLLIIGNADTGQIEQKLEEYALKDRVTYAGFQTKIEQYYGAADCFVFPSKYDAAANVVCEALASGIPVITTKTNGSHEFIEPGKNGYVIESAQDTEELKNAIERLSEHEDKTALRQHAAQTGGGYTMQRHVDEIEKQINQDFFH